MEGSNRSVQDDRGFDHNLWGYHEPHPDNLGHSIAYDDDQFHELVANAVLNVEKFVYGHWRGTVAMPNTQSSVISKPDRGISERLVTPHGPWYCAAVQAATS